MNDWTKVIHLPDGAPAPRAEPGRRKPRYPYIKTIVALAVIDMILVPAAIIFWIAYWEDISSGFR